MKTLLIIPLLLILFSIPVVYADVTIYPVDGSGTPSCESTGCYYSNSEKNGVVTVKVGEPILFHNTDSSAHTFTSGIVGFPPDGVFDSSLVSSGNTYEFNGVLEEGVTYPYFCIVHPWMVGQFLVENNDKPTTTTTTTTPTPPTPSDWQEKYYDVLNKFNVVSGEVGQLKFDNNYLQEENDRLHQENISLYTQISELEQTVDNLNNIVMEQVKVIYDWVLGNKI